MGAEGWVAIGLTWVAMACTPQAAPPSRPEPRPIEFTFDAPREVPVLAVLYRPAPGGLTSVGIYDRPGSYALAVERDAPIPCRSRWSEVVAERGRVQRLLAVLDPIGLSIGDPCIGQRRDGATWSVGARDRGMPLWRSRDAYGTLATEQCRAFDSACRQVMALALLECSGRGCYTRDELALGCR
jgi:hypothetical protein